MRTLYQDHRIVGGSDGRMMDTTGEEIESAKQDLVIQKVIVMSYTVYQTLACQLILK